MLRITIGPFLDEQVVADHQARQHGFTGDRKRRDEQAAHGDDNDDELHEKLDYFLSVVIPFKIEPFEEDSREYTRLEEINIFIFLFLKQEAHVE